MNQGKYIFAQLTDFLPRRVFDRLVEKYCKFPILGYPLLDGRQQAPV